MLNFTKEEFREIKTNGELLYKSLKEIYCPYFQENVSFGAHGLEHLNFKKRRKTRSEKDQYMRYKLLHLEPEILKTSHTLQGTLERRKFEKIRIHNRTDCLMKTVRYYEFIAVIKRNRVKIIVKQIENSTKFFWSIIPFWRMNMRTMGRILHDRTPEED